MGMGGGKLRLSAGVSFLVLLSGTAWLKHRTDADDTCMYIYIYIVQEEREILARQQKKDAGEDGAAEMTGTFFVHGSMCMHKSTSCV